MRYLTLVWNLIYHKTKLKAMRYLWRLPKVTARKENTC
nr:MAG TPA: hypothetical protein [Caudoviricetes sp.]